MIMPRSPEPPPDRRVLLADDDDDVREAIAELLRDEGWQVVEARDGVETLERASADRFDALILDHRMPGLLGGEVYQRLRAQNNLVPVILVTAVSGVGALASTLGIPTFLGKPFSAEDLLAALHRVTGRVK
jgi:CheY-like chemotaxis protein